MKKFLVLISQALLTGALIAAGITMSGNAATPEQQAADLSPRTAQIERQLDWDQHHIIKLNRRIDYLHRYIQHLRRATTPISTPTLSTSTSSANTSTYPSGNSGCLSATEVANYARGAGFPESAISTMVYYASRESGYCPGAINSTSGACGLWQLYPCYGGSAWLDPATNAHYAYLKYRASGFSPWGG